MPSRLSKSLQALAVTGATSIGAFFVYTKHSHFEPINPLTDSAYNSPSFRKYNPNNNPAFHDDCTRRIALAKIRPDLIRDADAGGSKLVETFCAGVWSSWGYTIQRKYLETKYRGSKTEYQLWTKQQLENSTYEPGTAVTDHFAVLEKSPTKVLMRCGDSPLKKPDGPRDSDGLFEIGARVDMDHGFAEFSLKSVFYSGEGKPEKPPFDGEPWIDWLHKQYAKLLMETAMRKCM